MEITNRMLELLRKLYNAPKMTKTDAQHKVTAARQFKDANKKNKPA